MGGKKTSGNGYINASGNQNGGNIEAGGSITHKPNKNTTIKVEGNINKPIHSHGKHNIGGGGSITISKDF